MPSFPSYYLNNLERKRQRSRDLSEGLDKGMAGVLGGVDRLAQMQQALEEKGLRAEALKHGRDIEAANQARADQRFAWEGEDRARRITQGDEDRERRNAQSDQKLWQDLQKGATQGNAALGGAPVVEKPADLLAQMKMATADREATDKTKGEIIQAAVESALATGEDPDEMNSRVRDYLADQGILGVGSSEVRAAFSKASAAKTDADLKRELLRSQVAENQAQAAKAARPPSETKAERDRLALEKAKAEIDALRARTEAARKKAGGGGALASDVDKVRKEFNALPDVKQYHDVATAVEKMKGAAKVPSAAGDLSLIFAFMKTLDPTSTVREGEFANAQNATGVPERIINEYNRVMSGERLNETQRADFLAQADNFLAAHKKAYDAAAESYSGLATRRGMEPGDVVMGADAPSAGPLGNAPPRDPSETRRAYYERLRAGGMDHQTALAAARGGQ